MAGEMAQTLQMAGNLILNEESADRNGLSLTLLIERARTGDCAAFDQIMICYQRKVVSTAWRMLGNEEDARDAAQEAFLRVYRYLNKYDERQEFAGWLYRIVVNVCRDIARKRGRNQGFASIDTERESGELDALQSSDDVEAAAILSQEKAIIANALDTLSNKEREAIVLRDLEGLSTEEVAQILGSSQTTVRSQISSARAKIKQYRDRVLNRRRQR